MRDKLLKTGNTKTGKDILLFNLPRESTCPGSTALCRQACLARRFKRFPQLDKLYAQALEASKSTTFVPDMFRELRERRPVIVRIHVSGDFYNRSYIRKWEKIIRATPGTAFFAYTRSWREPSLLAGLERLRRLPNMQLWWSTDHEAGRPPEGHVAYMSVNDEDRPEFDVNLVFRVNRRVHRRSIGGRRVCPKEACQANHPAYPRGLTCTTCGICFRSAAAQARIAVNS